MKLLLLVAGQSAWPLRQTDSTLIPDAWHNPPLDEPTHAAKRYATFSADNVKAAFAKWLKVEDLAEVILGPAPK